MSAIAAAVVVVPLAFTARPIASDHGSKLPDHFEATLVGFQENPFAPQGSDLMASLAMSSAC